MPSVPNVFTSPQAMAGLLGHVPAAVWMVLLVVVLVWLYITYRSVISNAKAIGVLVVVGGLVGVVLWLSKEVARWQHTAKTAKVSSPLQAIIPPGLAKQTGTLMQPSGINMQAANPTLHENPLMIALALVGTVGLIAYGVYQTMTKRTTHDNRVHTYKKYKPSGDFTYTPVELAVSKETKKPIIMEGKDRFINTLVMGVPGTGKTSRILSKAIVQDLRHIARGYPMDVVTMDPDGGLAYEMIQVAQQFGIPVKVIDFKGEHGNNVSLDLFTGMPSQVIENVRSALGEQMGRQEAFYANTQNDLIRKVIMVQKNIFPDSGFMKFAGWVSDLDTFREVCMLAVHFATDGSLKEAADQVSMPPKEAKELFDNIQRLTQRGKEIVLEESRSFLRDVQSEKKVETLTTVTKGLKNVVEELAKNPLIAPIIDENSPYPKLSFEDFFDQGKEEKGQLIAIVNGNTESGNLFGKLALIALKMAALNRKGSEETRRPTYLYVDEFPRYATNSLNDLFSQGRKYRIGLMLAFQARSQLVLAANAKFIELVEGACRNKIYFPAPAFEDARYLEKALGTEWVEEHTHSRSLVSYLNMSGRTESPKVSTREREASRFRSEDISFQLAENEAIFLMTVGNQQKYPEVGITSYATEWIKQQKDFYLTKQRVKKEPVSQVNERKKDPIRGYITEVASADADGPSVPESTIYVTKHLIRPASDGLKAVEQQPKAPDDQWTALKRENIIFSDPIHDQMDVFKGKTFEESMELISAFHQKQRELRGEPAPDFRAQYRRSYQTESKEVGSWLQEQEASSTNKEDMVIPVPEQKKPSIVSEEWPKAKVDKPFDREKDAPTCVKCGDKMALYDMKNVSGEVIKGNGVTQVSYRCTQCDSGTKKVLFLCNNCGHLSNRIMQDGAKFKVCSHCDSQLKES